MTGSAQQDDPQRLGELRAMIDAIDESVHRLLIQRAGVIDALIVAKGTAKTGAAFRPGREADMMRRLVARHSGNLPLKAVEHLWREIIATFTTLQAPFAVAVAAEGDPVAAVETARFAFGFTVPLHVLPSAAEVVAWMEDGGSDRLGVVPLDPTTGAWWEALKKTQVVARLPFLADERHAPSARPALVLSPPLADPVPFEVDCFVLSASARNALPAGTHVLAEHEGSLLAAAPGDALRDAGLDMRAVGGYAAPLRVSD